MVMRGMLASLRTLMLEDLADTSLMVLLRGLQMSAVGSSYQPRREEWAELQLDRQGVLWILKNSLSESSKMSELVVKSTLRASL